MALSAEPHPGAPGDTHRMSTEHRPITATTRVSILPFGRSELRITESPMAPVKDSPEMIRRLPEVTLKTHLVRPAVRAIRQG